MPPLVTDELKVTLVPEHIAPDGVPDMVTPAVPATGADGVRLANTVLVDIPVAVPVMPEGFTVPATALVLVGCTCRPIIVTRSVFCLLLPAMVITSDEAV